MSRELVAEMNRHRRLANYQYIGLHDRDEVWAEIRDESEYLSCVRHLQLSLHDRQMCEQAGDILLAHSPRIEGSQARSVLF